MSLSLSDGSVIIEGGFARLAAAVVGLLVPVVLRIVVVALEVTLPVVGLGAELPEGRAVVDDSLDCCASRFSRKSRRPSSAILFLSSSPSC